jgi:hypothetical protein
MSYKKKKMKKSFLNRLIYRYGKVKNVLLKNYSKIIRKEGSGMFPKTCAIMDVLSQKRIQARKDGMRIDREWVSGYIDECVRYGKKVVLLTQCCISKDLEVRYARQGDSFIPTEREVLLFEKEIWRIWEVFNDNGVAIDWWFTFNRSTLECGQVRSDVEKKFKEMVSMLSERAQKAGWLSVADWEDDIIGGKPPLSEEVLRNIDAYVPQKLFAREFDRHAAWARDDAGLSQTDVELKRDVRLRIAYEAEEGKMLVVDKFPFDNFLLLPLESPEQYFFFELLAPDFRKRIVPVLKLYPWRLRAEE